MKKLLFVCSENRLRSPTAETVFSEHDRVEAMGAGTNSNAANSAAPLVLAVMIKTHRQGI